MSKLGSDPSSIRRLASSTSAATAASPASAIQSSSSGVELGLSWGIAMGSRVVPRGDGESATAEVAGSRWSRQRHGDSKGTAVRRLAAGTRVAQNQRPDIPAVVGSGIAHQCRTGIPAGRARPRISQLNIVRAERRLRARSARTVPGPHAPRRAPGLRTGRARAVRDPHPVGAVGPARGGHGRPCPPVGGRRGRSWYRRREGR